MSIFQALILGIIQGLTEFMPVSSSGHLVITKKILEITEVGIPFDVVVHFGSLLAVLIYFRKRILAIIKNLFEPDKKYSFEMIAFLIVATIPAVIVAVFFKDFIKSAFSNEVLASSMLILTGAMLFSTRFIKIGRDKISLWPALIMGISQSLAILPGLSRSGTTIFAGMLKKVDPAEAAEFSFLMSIPAILGALIFNLKDLSEIGSQMTAQYLVGLLSSFIFSLVAVYAVLTAIKKGKFEYFGYYCLAAGGLGLYLFL